ncbi:MAG: AgmX/PglI C-terminal domain-containing protein [Fibrobacteres bacterium]|jgi:outer membrane biosynthesis protein TonB|nr:AgmX/PglI C-terminal domain-containing protein [Fibrobacterota bacterium]
MRTYPLATALILAATFLALPAAADHVEPPPEPNQIDAILAGKGNAPTAQIRATVDPPKAGDVQLSQNTAQRETESVSRLIRGHIGSFRYSYEKRLRKKPRLQGKLVLGFTISAEGDIVKINKISSTIGDAELEQAILDKARHMKFDQTQDGSTTVRYSMVLRRPK